MPRSNWLANSVQLLTLTLLSAPVFAADNHKVEEVIVSTAHRSEKPISRNGSSISAVQSQEIEFVGATHINEIMQRQSGLNFSRNSGQEYLASIRSPIFTGAGACGAFLTLQDGIALRAAGFCNVNELFESFTEVAERIEVTRGPGSALYGSNALHGTINVITMPAKSDDGFAKLETGSYGALRLSGSKGWTNGNHGIRLATTINHDGGYRDDSGFDQQKVSLRHDYTGEKWEFASYVGYTNLEQDTAGYLVGLDAYKDRAFASTNPNPEAYRNAQSLRYWSRGSTMLSDDLRLQLASYFRTQSMEFLMHFLPGKPLEENSQTSIGLQSGLYFGEDSALEIVAGVDLEYARGSLNQTQANATVGSAFLQATIPAGKQYDYAVDSYMGAGYLQLDYAASEWLRINIGARLEAIGYHYTNNMVSGRTDENGNGCGFGGCRYNRPESRNDSFVAFTPKVSLLYSISADQQLFLSVSHGYRAPQATELYRLQRSQSVADLKKVSLTNVELGIRRSAGPVRYSLSAYAMQKDNFIFRDADFFNINGGKSKHLGLEATLNWAIDDSLALSVNGNWARHTYDFDYVSNGISLNGNDIDTAPRHFGSAQLRWAPVTHFSTELEWVHMGSYFLDPENLHRYEGHNYFNMRLAHNLTGALKLYARVTNLIDAKYAERADYTRFTEERYFPGRPRSIFVGIKLSL